MVEQFSEYALDILRSGEKDIHAFTESWRGRMSCLTPPDADGQGIVAFPIQSGRLRSPCHGKMIVNVAVETTKCTNHTKGECAEENTLFVR